jgi:2-aminoadipate transaminase
MAMISFARGVPAPECLPVEDLADCAKVAIERDGRTILSYGAGGGYGPLREWIGARHGVAPGRVMLTNGGLQGFVFLTSHFFGGGKTGRVLVEAPTYDRPLKILAAAGAEIVPLTMDDEGLDPDALEAELRRGPKPAFVYSIPTFQNPSGRTLSAERRTRIAEIVREHEVLLLEDDPYGLVRYEGTPQPSLFSLDGGDHVAYTSSFSKTVAPGVRVGYFIFPEAVGTAVEAIAVSNYISPVMLSQAAVFEFVNRGRFEPNLERVIGLLGARRTAMLESLERELGGSGATWSHPEGGYFLWLDFPAGIDCGELLPRAEAAGVTFVKGTDFFQPGGGGTGAARLAFSFVSPDEIRQGVATLASLLS